MMHCGISTIGRLDFGLMFEIFYPKKNRLPLPPNIIDPHGV